MRLLITVVVILTLLPVSATAHSQRDNSFVLSVSVVPVEEPGGNRLNISVDATANHEHENTALNVWVPSFLPVGFPNCVGDCGRAKLHEDENRVSAFIPSAYRSSATIVFSASVPPALSQQTAYTIKASAGSTSIERTFVLEGTSTVADNSERPTGTLNLNRDPEPKTATVNAVPEAMSLPRSYRATVEIHMDAPTPGLLTVVLPKGIVPTSANSGCVDIATMTIPDPPLCRVHSSIDRNGNTVLRVQVPAGSNVYVLQVMNLSAEPASHQIEYTLRAESSRQESAVTEIDARNTD